MALTYPPGVRGDVARALRLARGLTLSELSARTGIDPGTLKAVEDGRRPGRPHLATLAEHLGVPTAVLTGQRSPLAALREAAGLTREALADQVGAAPEHVHDLEVPDVELVRRIADRLGVPATVLAHIDDAA